ARAAIGLDHIAIQRDRPIAERLEINDAAQRAADQTLDLLCAAALLALRSFAAAACMRGARQHAVFASDPAFALAFQPARHALLNTCRAEHMRLPELRQA